MSEKEKALLAVGLEVECGMGRLTNRLGLVSREFSCDKHDRYWMGEDGSIEATRGYSCRELRTPVFLAKQWPLMFNSIHKIIEGVRANGRKDMGFNKVVFNNSTGAHIHFSIVTEKGQVVTFEPTIGFLLDLHKTMMAKMKENFPEDIVRSFYKRYMRYFANDMSFGLTCNTVLCDERNHSVKITEDEKDCKASRWAYESNGGKRLRLGRNKCSSIRFDDGRGLEWRNPVLSMCRDWNDVDAFYRVCFGVLAEVLSRHTPYDVR